MKKDGSLKKRLSFLEELRSIAQLGLNYSLDPYDRERYSRLLDLACKKYSELASIPAAIVKKRLAAELGHITPKVGAQAAIFDQQGKILLVRRSDDGRWSLPCGWVELNESPQQALRRELREETGLAIRVLGIIEVYSRLPGDFGQPHTSCHLVFHCARVSGRLGTSSEVLEAKFFDPAKVRHWHREHRAQALRAKEYWHGLRSVK